MKAAAGELVTGSEVEMGTGGTQVRWGFFSAAQAAALAGQTPGGFR